MSDLSIPSIRRILIIPALLFVVCMAAFIYLEQKTSFNNIQSDQIFDQRSSNILLDVAKRIYQLPTSLGDHSDPLAVRVEVQAIHALTAQLTKHFLYLDLTVPANSQQFNALEELKKSLRALMVTFDEGKANDFGQTLHAVHQNTFLLNRTIVSAREERTKLHLKQLAQDHRYRILFAVAALLCGLALMGGVVEGIRHFRQHAKRVEAAEDVNALFAAALQSTRVGVLIRDVRKKETPVVFVNHAFEDMTGYKFSEIPSDNMNFLFGWKTDNKTMTAFRRAISLRENATFDMMVYRKNGEPFWSEWHLSPIVGEGGDTTYFVSMFNDMTSMRQTQEDLLQAKQIAERAAAVKTNFLAMMSHEIRTPINGIQGVLRLIDETDLDAEQKHLLGIAITSSKALHRIINDILDYAKMEAGKVKIVTETFVMQHLMDGALSLAHPMIGGKKVELGVTIMDGMPACLIGDVGRLHQIILNLVSNAIKFTDDGSVHIRVLPLMEQQVRGKAGMLVRFEVQDSGMGISPAQQDKLFKEFSQVDHSTTRRFGGTGLGLAICKRLVTMMNGEIGVESQVGKGSKFWFMLPLEVANEENLKLEALQEQRPRTGGKPPERFKILLVEDNATNRLVAGRYLEKAGFKVDEACDGQEAVEKAKQCNYDLILMDISMPIMDGMLATCHIREEGGHNANMPIVALTAHAMAGDRDMCLEVGMNDYLHKPIEYAQLVKTLERWLDVDMMPALRQAQKLIEATPPKDTEATTQKENPPVSAPLENADIPVFDSAPLDRMQDMLGGESVGEVIDTFLSDSPSRIEILEQDDLEVVRDSAHTLKSSAGNCGLMSFSNCMRQLEKAAGDGVQERVNVLCKEAPVLYAASVEKLKTYRKSI